MKFFVVLAIIAAAFVSEDCYGFDFDTSHPIVPGACRMSVYVPLLKGKRVGVFANQTSLIGETNLVDTLLKEGVIISKIFSPEHGFRGTADAGDETNDFIDPATKVPVISLYGKK